ncbi:MAG TPA: lamin tail domain-containing protein [Anaerolineae bacterium]|nr:lamin tail domain-containing protein [Anaerolineae bacterium]
MAVRRMAIFIAVNAIVSAIVVLVVLSLWDAGRSSIQPLPTIVPKPIAQTTFQPIQPIAVTATPTVPRSYIVQPGDTPFSIATDLGISVNDLLSANHLIEGDILNIGQELIVPAAGFTPDVATATPLSVSTTRPNPTPAATSAGGLLVTIRQIDSLGDVVNESVVLTNLGGKVNLSGWTLSDGEGHKYTFPDLTLLTNAEAHVHTTVGPDSAVDLYWGQASAMWNGSGTIAYLRDPSGKLMATYRVP